MRFLETRIVAMTPEHQQQAHAARGGFSNCQNKNCPEHATHAVWRVARPGSTDQRLFLCELHAKACQTLQEIDDAGGWDKWRMRP